MDFNCPTLNMDEVIRHGFHGLSGYALTRQINPDRITGFTQDKDTIT
jgi:hypothetical protein